MEDIDQPSILNADDDEEEFDYKNNNDEDNYDYNSICNENNKDYKDYTVNKEILNQPNQVLKNKVKDNILNMINKDKETENKKPVVDLSNTKDKTLITSISLKEVKSKVKPGKKNENSMKNLKNQVNNQNSYTLNSQISLYKSVASKTNDINEKKTDEAKEIYSKMDNFDKSHIHQIASSNYDNKNIIIEENFDYKDENINEINEDYYERIDDIDDNSNKINQDLNDNPSQFSVEDIKILKEQVNPHSIDKFELYKRYTLAIKRYEYSQSQILSLSNTLSNERIKYKEMLDSLKNDSSLEFKDKKLIELSKKVSDLNIKLEKMKLNEKEQQSKIVLLESKSNNLNKSKEGTMNNMIINQNNSFLKGEKENQVEESDVQMKKKQKQLENKISELLNKNQTIKNENIRLEGILKREIGDGYEKEISKENWKGKAEMIEILKGRIKQLEQVISNKDLLNQGSFDENTGAVPLSLASIHTNKLSNSVPFSQYKKEKEEFKKEITLLQQEKEKLNLEYSRTKSRKEVLEKELKSQKDDLTSKIKILLEKNDNDEKLISALNRELEKRTGKSITGEDVVFNMKQEIIGLREEIKEKNIKYEKLEKQILGSGKSEISLLGLLEKVDYLEMENRELKNNTGEGKIYDALARENASLRLKLYQKDK